MNRLKWEEKYSIGDTKIDDQHKNIFSLMRKFYKSVIAGTDQNQIRSVLDSLTEYCEIHFIDEERLMRSVDYPDIKNHKSFHDSFRNNIHRLCKEYEDTGDIKTLEILVTIIDWLSEHIMIEDQQIKAYIEQNSQHNQRSIN